MSRWRPLLALLCAAVSLAGCAAIPENSRPQAVRGEDEARRTAQVPEPRRDLDPLSLVRNFVEFSANPDGDHAAAKPYLTQDAQRSWNSKASLTIITDNFDTVYDTNPDGAQDDDRRTVVLRGKNVGRLGGDSAFVPEVGNYELQITVNKQPDGQWRITNPPNGVVVSSAGFSGSYRGVRVYFFDNERGVLVPDLRYVVAQPPGGMPARVIELLLSGPSEVLRGAVRSTLPNDAMTRTNVADDPDGALVVDLKNLGDQSTQNRKLIAAQIVLSLQGSTNSRVRLKNDGVPMFADHVDWRPGDIPSFEAETTPSAELPGLMVVRGQVLSLRDGSPLAGPAASGERNVLSAAQSTDGSQLALVVRVGDAVQLRIGKTGQSAHEVFLPPATELTRPTWKPGSSAANSANELWTVADHASVLRVVSTPEGGWATRPVNATELAQYGQITELRLSRDGVRVAAVVGGRLVVGTVVRNQDSVSIRAPRPLLQSTLTSVVGVDWQAQDTLVVATASNLMPVAKVPVDGLEASRYNSSNLTAPLRQITAAPGRQVVVVDSGGMWTASDASEVWRVHPANQGAEAVPFYPG